MTPMVKYCNLLWKAIYFFNTPPELFQHASDARCCDFKAVYNDHPRNPNFVAVGVRWSLLRGSAMLYKLKLGPQNRGRCRQVVVAQRLYKLKL